MVTTGVAGCGVHQGCVRGRGGAPWVWQDVVVHQGCVRGRGGAPWVWQDVVVHQGCVGGRGGAPWVRDKRWWYRRGITAG